MKKYKIRIYQPDNMYVDAKIKLDIRNTYYCQKVMRLKQNNQIIIFNNNSEWIGNIINSNKKEGIIIKIQKPTNKTNVENNVSLFISIIKEKSMKIAIRQCVELGIDQIIPIITKYNTTTFNSQRSALHVIEACEQSGRLSLPKILKPITFSNLINENIFKNKTIIWCYEHAKHKTQTIHNTIQANKKIGILIGPEAGFSNIEANILKQLKNVFEISLGKNILRADTAASVALSNILFIKNL